VCFATCGKSIEVWLKRMNVMCRRLQNVICQRLPDASDNRENFSLVGSICDSRANPS
jgi:hypothetical protein